LYTTSKQKLSRIRLFAAVSYRDILDRAAVFFDEVAREQPKELQCSGCSLCCYGLFEISAAEIPIIAEGLEQLHPSRRKLIVRRAVDIVAKSAHPNLRECTPTQKNEFFDRTASTACPNLSDVGRCMIYDHRPLVCRTFGLPLREADRYVGDVCDLNFKTASDDEKMAAAWDLNWEDRIGKEDEYTVPEAIVAIARLRGWLA
jgi:Fe-S-cluster containining protein